MVEYINPCDPLLQIIVETLPLPRLVLRAPFRPKYRSKTALGSSPNANTVSWYWLVYVARLKASTLPLNLNVLMLYDNMEQLTKLCVFLSALLTWTDCSIEVIIK